MLYTILASILLGSSISKIITKLILPVFPNFLFDTSIIGVTETIAKAKTYDMLEFTLTAIFSTIFFLVNFVILRKRDKKPKTKFNLTIIAYLLFTIIVFIQSHYVNYSGKLTLLLIITGQTLFVLVSILEKPNIIRFDSRKFANSLLTGFVLLLIANQLTTSVAIPLLLLCLSPVIYLYIPVKYDYLTKSPTHLALALGIIAPTNLLFLFLLLVTTGAITFLCSNILAKYYNAKHINSIIYPTVFIILITFNPLYFAGNLDSIEEGFWLAWLKRLKDGDTMYKDFAAYHPPLIPWLMNIFAATTSYTIKNVRLFFHILEIVGVIIFYFVSVKIIKSNILRATLLLLVLALTSTMVRNNVEIRLGMGLLSILLFYKYIQKRKSIWMMWSGIVASISLFVSVEVGVTTILAISLVSILFTGRLKSLKTFAAGLFLGAAPILIYLSATKSLVDGYLQVSIYANAFSKGYFNVPLERLIQTSFLRWHIIWQSLSETSFYWEVARIGILTTAFYLFTIMFKNNKFSINTLSDRNKFALTLTIWTAILFRPALGRSDFHHLLFILPTSLLLIMYLVETQTKKSVYYLYVSLIFITIFAPKLVNERYLSRKIFTLTTYGEVVEEYKTYDSPNAGILISKDANPEKLNEFYDYLENNTNEDDKIFVFPWNPEVYFISDRDNATTIDIPYTFWQENYQNQMLSGLESNNPKYIITNPRSKFGNVGSKALPIVNDYINQNYQETAQIHDFKILEKVEAI